MKILVTVAADYIASRFDLCTEVLIAQFNEDKTGPAPRTVLLPGPSADELCSLILKENIDVVVCGGIEDSFFKYLVWKKVVVIDRVIGLSSKALQLVLEERLHAGAVI
ncbi:MAG: hypothetical protein HQL10_01235 [Nitrospirae bacterium]|nr:hypothetical protein [Nitrospirota bacterium]